MTLGGKSSFHRQPVIGEIACSQQSPLECIITVDFTARMKKQSCVTLLAVIAAICVLVPLVRFARREAQYIRSRNAFSDALKPGMKRSEVEAYLRSRNVEFSRSCCSGAKRDAMDDLVEVGHEKAGLICMERSVYVAFQFAAVERNQEWVADSDRLVNTTLDRSVCLDLP